MLSLLVIAAALAFPAAASGSIASFDGNSLLVQGENGERNRMVVILHTSGAAITDTEGVIASPGCITISGGVFCPGTVQKATIQLRDRSDALQVGSGISATTSLSGGLGDDSIIGTGGNDTITGDQGSDQLDGRSGADSLSGGQGQDLVTYAVRLPGQGVRVTIDGRANDGGTVDDAIGPLASRDNVKRDVENLVGGAGRDFLRGDGDGNLISGRRGGDRIRGLDGDDRLTGGSGVDVLLGNRGLDTLFSSDGRRDRRLACGPGPNLRESARRDRRDPGGRSC